MIKQTDAPIVILAGAGLLPATLAQRMRSDGQPFKMLAFRGFADKATTLQADQVRDLLDVRGILACLKEWTPSGVVMAGAVHRPRPSALLGSFSLLLNMNELKEIVIRGDDHLLKGAIALLEDNGFPVLGAHEIAPEIMSSEGVFTNRQPSDEEMHSIASGLQLLNTIAKFDIGQGLVIVNQHVLAIEGPEGTDKMIRRVGSLQKKRLFARTAPAIPNSVFIKTAKVQQDLRIDMPTIGPRTIIEAYKAGIRGVAIGAAKTLIVDKEKTIEEANRRNMFLIGVPVD
ncbi:UDP-2,3-diacylglucosamine diphosphatase LpxI [Microvirga sp. W0021]|uniref:UDP-2,3-diacylglucosamine diphosphatase LpxI n=1 Tax=Hohaiivirga grylli TaxID=3133970 RepID=A0ABV0BLU7_9HYPH